MSSRGRDDPDEFTRDARHRRIVVDPSVEQGRWLLLNGHCLVSGKIEYLFMRGHNAHRNLCVGCSTSDSAHCDNTYVPCSAEIYVHFATSDKLLNLLATASVSCRLDELGKTAHVNGNQTLKRSGAQPHEESGCAVAPSGHNATHVPARESSNPLHTRSVDVEKAGVNKLLAKQEELGFAHESWSSARLLCT